MARNDSLVASLAEREACEAFQDLPVQLRKAGHSAIPANFLSIPAAASREARDEHGVVDLSNWTRLEKYVRRELGINGLAGGLQLSLHIRRKHILRCHP